MGKSAQEVVAAICEMERGFPFSIKAIYSDCGTEIINETMREMFKLRFEKVIELYRSRLYKKNDNDHVEQKNNEIFIVVSSSNRWLASRMGCWSKVGSDINQ